VKNLKPITYNKGKFEEKTFGKISGVLLGNSRISPYNTLGQFDKFGKATK